MQIRLWKQLISISIFKLDKKECDTTNWGYVYYMYVMLIRITVMNIIKRICSN